MAVAVGNGLLWSAVRAVMVVAAAAAALSVSRRLYVHAAAPKAQKKTPAGNKLPRTVHKTVHTKDLKPGRLVIVGDVHGCATELQGLLEKVAFRPDEDNLIFVGDLVNKGPSSIEVLDMLLGLEALSVRGNHDDAALQRWAEWRATGKSLKDKHAWVTDMQARHVRALEELPFTLSLPDYGITVVHAGLLPQRQLEHQALWDMYKMRNCAAAAVTAAGAGGGGGDAEGQSLWIALEKAKDGGQAWASLWPGPSHVFFGHDAKRKLQRCTAATGLDTGCVFGFLLTAAVVPPLHQLLEEPATGQDVNGIALGRKLQTGEPVTREDLKVQLVSVAAARAYEPRSDGSTLTPPADAVAAAP